MTEPAAERTLLRPRARSFWFDLGVGIHATAHATSSGDRAESQVCSLHDSQPFRSTPARLDDGAPLTQRVSTGFASGILHAPRNASNTHTKSNGLRTSGKTATKKRMSRGSNSESPRA